MYRHAATIPNHAAAVYDRRIWVDLEGGNRLWNLLPPPDRGGAIRPYRLRRLGLNEYRTWRTQFLDDNQQLLPQYEPRQLEAVFIIATPKGSNELW